MIVKETALSEAGIFSAVLETGQGRQYAFTILPVEDLSACLVEARANAERLLGEPAPDIPAPHITKEMRDLYAQRQTESDMSFFI